MPHINLPEGLPGISAGFAFRPETAKPMRELAHILLHEPSSLTPGERELIATYVSSRNCTTFCVLSHGAAAANHLGDAAIVEQVKSDFLTAPISAKAQGAADDRRQGAAGWQTRDRIRCAGRANAGRDRSRDSRHGSDRRGILDVQPLRRRTRDCAAHRSRHVRADGKAPGREGIHDVFDPAAGRRLN